MRETIKENEKLLKTGKAMKNICKNYQNNWRRLEKNKFWKKKKLPRAEKRWIWKTKCGKHREKSNL